MKNAKIIFLTLISLSVIVLAQSTAYKGITANGVTFDGDIYSSMRANGFFWGHRGDEGVLKQDATNTVFTWINNFGESQYNAIQYNPTNQAAYMDTAQFGTNIYGGPIKGLHFNHVGGNNFMTIDPAAQGFSGNTKPWTYICLISPLTNFNGAIAVSLGYAQAPPVAGSSGNRLTFLPAQSIATASINYRSSTAGVDRVVATISGGVTTNRFWYLTMRYSGTNFNLGRNLIFGTNSVYSDFNIPRDHNVMTYGLLRTTNSLSGNNTSSRSPFFIAGDWFSSNYLDATTLTNTLMQLDANPRNGFHIFTK